MNRLRLTLFAAVVLIGLLIADPRHEAPVTVGGAAAAVAFLGTATVGRRTSVTEGLLFRITAVDVIGTGDEPRDPSGRRSTECPDAAHQSRWLVASGVKRSGAEIGQAGLRVMHAA